MVIVSCVCAGLAVFVVVWLMICGYLWTWGPFSGMANIRFRNLAGNSDAYSVENVEELENSPLEGMNICYLGSSVTYGASSLQTSFVEYIAKRNGTTFVKEAVSGTTLVDTGINSYISRMESWIKGRSSICLCASSPPTTPRRTNRSALFRRREQRSLIRLRSAGR